jgi:hypothetical protein
MSELLLVRTSTGTLAPMDDEGAEWLRKRRVGSTVRGKFSEMRNGGFHRKFFKMLDFGYGIWAETKPPMEYRGEKILPDREAFRERMIILAGFSRMVFTLDGQGFELKAKSIRWDRMEQDEFEALYSAVLNRLLSDVIGAGGMTREQVDEAVDNLMRFDG